MKELLSNNTKSARKNTLTLKMSQDPKVGYVYLPTDARKTTNITKTISLYDLVEDYNGIPVYLDFEENKE